jgi:hypothetical protein
MGKKRNTPANYNRLGGVVAPLPGRSTQLPMAVLAQIMEYLPQCHDVLTKWPLWSVVRFCPWEHHLIRRQSWKMLKVLDLFAVDIPCAYITGFGALPRLRRMCITKLTTDCNLSTVLLVVCRSTSLQKLQLGNMPVYHDDHRWTTTGRWYAPSLLCFEHTAHAIVSAMQLRPPGELRMLHNLTTLCLSGTCICATELGRVIQVGVCPRMRELFVDLNHIDDPGAQALVLAFRDRTYGHRGLDRLELGYNKITCGDVLIRIITQWAVPIRYLGIGGNMIEQIEFIPMPRLMELIVECNWLQLSCLEHLVTMIEQHKFPELLLLDLEDNDITFAQQVALYSRVNVVCNTDESETL